MSSIKTSHLYLLLGMALLLGGCGDKNPQADLEPNSGKHLASWLPAGHTTAAKDHLEACTECHGSDFTGGISKVACTQCHLESRTAPHPAFWNYTSSKPTAWGTYAYAFHGAYAKQKGTNSCAVASCHGSDLTGVAGSGPSCKSCHKDIMSVHPIEWVSRLTTSPGGIPTLQPDHGIWFAKTESASCANAVCHGSEGQGVFLSGYKCSGCHNSGF